MNTINFSKHIAMTKIISTLVLFFFIHSICLFSQQKSISQQNKYLNYAPVPSEQTPLKYVRLIMHVFQKSDSTASFPDNETSRQWLRDKYLGHLNWRMGYVAKMNLPTSSPHIKDSRVRYHLDTIFFHQDDKGWDMYCPGLSKGGCNISYSLGQYLYKKYVIDNENLKNRYNAVNIFIGENATGMGRSSGIGDKRWVMVAGVYTHSLDDDPNGCAALLRHELGHNLGLLHTWNCNDGCDDTPRNRGCWNGDTCSNNMMDYNACQCALTTCQAGRIHYYLSGMKGDISDAVIKDYCENNNSTMKINSNDNVIWNCRKYIKGNIRIEENATLTITCQTSIPKDGYIEIHETGKLIIDGGIITNTCGEKWRGTIVTGKQFSTEQMIQKGYIVLKNDGKINNYKR